MWIFYSKLNYFSCCFVLLYILQVKIYNLFIGKKKILKFSFRKEKKNPLN